MENKSPQSFGRAPGGRRIGADAQRAQACQVRPLVKYGLYVPFADLTTLHGGRPRAARALNIKH
jgi:hypothetical protein